jgi:hemerythrin-like metal-binding protein
LVSYTTFHFAREEEFFAKTGYPAATHKKEHDDLVKQVLELQARYRSGELALSLATVEFVKNWLINHIQGCDQKYGAHLNAKGIH